MDYLLIDGPQQFCGEVSVSTSKNAVLPILVATIMCKQVTLNNLPHLEDVSTLLALLLQLGVKFTWHDDRSIDFDPTGIHSYEAKYELVRRMRASFWIIGPLLARFGYARVSMPGGCKIGARPVDIYLAALREMGVEVSIENGFVTARAPKGLQAARLKFPFPSVGATHVTIMAAALANGQTIIEGAACEPEIIDLADFLNAAGAKITGAGTTTIVIDGVSELGKVCYSIIPDRIEAATFLIGAAMTQSLLTVKNCRHDHLHVLLDLLRQSGAKIDVNNDAVTIDMREGRPKAVDITTAVYPGFPTDLQAPMIAFNTVADGRSVVVEHLFENRFMHVPELVRLGADIAVSGNQVTINGVNQLAGAQVQATDLRAAAALVLAATRSHGQTIISKIHHIERGYVAITEKLSACGITSKRLDCLPDGILSI